MSLSELQSEYEKKKNNQTAEFYINWHQPEHMLEEYSEKTPSQR